MRASPMPIRPVMLTACLLLASAASAQERPVRWPAPELDDDNLRQWMTFIRPTREELKWRQVRWHKSLSVAEAKRLQRPILLWTMNGHPCGET